MNEAQQYIQAIDGDLRVLYQQDPPAKRLRGIYRTSWHQISYEHASTLWLCLRPLRGILVNLDAAPGHADYCETLLGCALDIERQLKKVGRHASFGVGQKVANLFMKDQWALGRADHLEYLLHAPIDRRILHQIPNRREIAPSWSAWTKVAAGDRDARTVYEYMELQAQLREMAEVKHIPRIRLEQQMWGGSCS